MDEFYQMLNDLCVNHKCPDCNELMWTQYADGHVSETCLCCGFPENLNLLEPASYVTRYPVPEGPVPANIEVIDKPEKRPWELSHESKYYRISEQMKSRTYTIQDNVSESFIKLNTLFETLRTNTVVDQDNWIWVNGTMIRKGINERKS